MSWLVTIVPCEETSTIGKYGHVRRMLSDQWEFNFDEADCFGGAVVNPDQYELRVSFDSHDQNLRLRDNIKVGKPYTEDEMLAIGSAMLDVDSIESIHLTVVNEGRKVLITICRFCERYNLRLLDGDTREEVELSRIEESDIYGRALLEKELSKE